MTVEPIKGEPFRFHVQSESRKAVKHLVDLQAKDYQGWCGCEDEEFRGRRCKHIQAARDWLLDRFLQKLAIQTAMTGGRDEQ